MKKLLAVIFLFSGILGAYATNFSVSDNGLNLNGDVTRVGNNIKMKYTISGEKIASISSDSASAISNAERIDIEMLVSCSAPKMQILAANIYSKDGSVTPLPSASDWLPIENQADIEKYKKFCSSF